MRIIMYIIWHNKFNKNMLIAHALKHNLFLKNKGKGFPGGSVVKNPPAKAGDRGLIPGPGRFHAL